jgi:site-specific recombinase XerD
MLDSTAYAIGIFASLLYPAFANRRRGRPLEDSLMDSTLSAVRIITEKIRRAIIKTGLSERPYVLRSYFASHLLEAELDGKTSTDI